MAWKQSAFYFAYQSIKYAKSIGQFRGFWKFYTAWKQSFRAGRNSVVDELPWLNLPALQYLEKNVTQTFKIYEYGGGGSTLFFCARAAEVVTVEDHQEWFSTLTQTVQNKSYTNWQGRFISSETIEGNPNRSHEDPADFKSGAKGLEHLSFEKYARSIHDFPENYFDLVLVDGRARPSCIQEAMPHLKSGGLLVVDNTERPYYLAPFRSVLASAFEKVLEVQAPVYYTPDFTITSIYRKR